MVRLECLWITLTLVKNRVSISFLSLLFALMLASIAWADNLSLPDPLKFEDGRLVSRVEDWKGSRRSEVLELFRKNVYGRDPVARPSDLAFEVEESVKGVMDGNADRKIIRIKYCGQVGMRLILFTPAKTRIPAPVFLLICNRGPENIDPSRTFKSPFWPAEVIINRGYAAAAFLNSDVAPDTKDAWQKGVHKLYNPAEGRRPDSWGTIAAWAWGASRAMDYLVTDAAIDARRVAVVGHSRGGKTALWAAAQDERFAMAISNDSGCTGAALARGKSGERIKDINRAFPYWFCENYRNFNDREEELPVDQHMLLGLMAPRLLYVASASEDAWADPKSEFRAAVHAGPVYQLHGLVGLSDTHFPSPENPIHGGHIGYHLRTGKHNLTEYDWEQYMTFADKHGWGRAGLP